VTTNPAGEPHPLVNSPWFNRRHLIQKFHILEDAGFPDDVELRRLVIHLGLTFDETRRLAECFTRVLDVAITKKRGRKPGWSPVRRRDRELLLGLERQLDRQLAWKDIDSVASEADGSAQIETRRTRLSKRYSELLSERTAAMRLITPDNSA
jgi:hypothetical protein